MNAKEKINAISKLCLAGEGWGGGVQALYGDGFVLNI